MVLPLMRGIGPSGVVPPDNKMNVFITVTGMLSRTILRSTGLYPYISLRTDVGLNT